ncbi:effector binding domain-containing protein [Paenibacillus sp. FSL L8-0463]|uniref:effector binding domain-containing protein n=1 Tax=Paenibacillus sp. FSL L8-0463 TaxID=2954687 RepID=UPI003119E03E
MDYRVQLEKALIFIENNLNNTISVTDVAKAASYSYYHFHRFFQAMMGETVGSYIRSRRLTQAAKELLYTNKRILDIAVSLQFESHEAFSRAFKSQYHLTPNQYRKNRVETILGSRREITKPEIQHRCNSITLRPQIVDVEPKQLVGIRFQTSVANNQSVSKWEYFQSRVHEIPHALPDSCRYGIFESAQGCTFTSFSEQSQTSEFIGIEVNDTSLAPDKMCYKKFPGGKYARFTHTGKTHSLFQSYQYIWGTWLSASDVELAARDDFECYSERFLGTDNPESQIDIYFPIK